MTDDNKNDTKKKPLAIGGKPLTIGGRATGKKSAGIVQPARTKANTKNDGNDVISEAERKRRLAILERAGDVNDKLRKDAEEAERKAVERKKIRDEEEAKRVAQDEARKKREVEKHHKNAAVEKEPETVKMVEPVVDAVKPKNVFKAKEVSNNTESKPEKKVKRTKGDPERRQKTKMHLSNIMDGDDIQEGTGPSLASIRRRREKEKMKAKAALQSNEKIIRDVTIPEVITVSDLANRMSERTIDVIKELMKLGVMATAQQTVDADTAELVVTEMGHRFNRVAESDVEDNFIQETQDKPEDMKSRAPVVTVMGHVDHGKTSLLDVLRSTDVVAGEAGGITQHIGAYSVKIASGETITFLDTPGHEAFTSMRQRGANVTDIVILVVAADDGIMPQTIEAINHAKAGDVPVIVAINKIDVDGADPNRIQTQLLEHGIQTEHFGGDVLAVEVSAKNKMNIDKLEEAILLQASLLELKANENADARGAVVEAKMERGRGSVATVLVQKGALTIGQIFVAGNQWGRVRAIINDKGQNLKKATPSMPVEVLGWNGTPEAGDAFAVVDTEAQAREIVEYRNRKLLAERSAVSVGKGSVEDIFAQIKKGEIAELPIIIKADTQGSLEAIKGSLEKLENEEVKVKVMHGAAGGITQSDVTLADSVGGMIVGFNVRANAEARTLSEKQGLDIRYYSIIYDLVNDMKGLLSGMLAPEVSENIIGHAEIRQVFRISKVGNIAGCYVTDGSVQRGAGVRLLRNDVVIYEGSLKQLKREKDDAKEVKNNYECGMMFENFDDIKEGDIVECYVKVETQRTL